MVKVITDDNIYPVGSLVRAIKNPAVLMFIESYGQKIYYCRIQDRPEENEKPFFGRELMADNIKQT